MNPALLPKGGRPSGLFVIGEVTEALQRYLIEGYDLSDRVPRVEEDLKYVPKDRQEVIYTYMYRLAQNPNLQNRKRLRLAPIRVEDDGPVYYHRPPLLLDLYYLVTVHARFRSEAERLLGWVLLRLHEATHLIYRPRRFVLPDGREVDSLGRPYDPSAPIDDAEDELFVEKVSLALVDDLTLGDAINLFTLLEAPYRPFLTYRARVALDGPLYAGAGGTEIRMQRARPMPPSPQQRGEPSPRTPPGPRAHRLRPLQGPAKDEPQS